MIIYWGKGAKLPKIKYVIMQDITLLSSQEVRDLLALNGSVNGDSFGEYTHFTKRSGSVIDCIAVSHFEYEYSLLLSLKL